MTSHSRRAFALSLLAPLLPAALVGCRRRSSTAAPAERGLTVIEVDASKPIGAFHRLSGVHGSPAPIVDGEPDRTREFREAGIALSRFPQDCYPNTLTLAGIFPDENADPDSPESYRFEGIDRHVRAARAAGAEVLWQSSYDVGGSDRWVGPNLGGRAPVNVERWGRVVTRCLEHFNNGFARGLDYAVKHVEFVNEPDGLGGFNGGHEKRLLPTFLAFLDAIERYNRAHPTTPVRAVGPGIPLSFAEWPLWQPRFDTALREIRAAGRTLPVFSFHTYGKDVSPRANERLAHELRSLLDRNGYAATELWNTEWLAADFLREHLAIDRERAARATLDEQRQFASAMAAYAVACKLRWQGLLKGSCYYRANRRAFPLDYVPPFAGGSGVGQFFGPDARVNPPALQERLLADVHARTPERCSTSVPSDDAMTALGLCSSATRAVSVLIASLSTTAQPLSLRISGFGAAKARARVAVLDGRAELTPRELPTPTVRDGRLTLDVTAAPLSSLWVVCDALA